ncbi:HAD family hydrolase [Pseudomonas sp. RL]|uniref:HAD family hydrolase n=1 Tax=Pseudomonas sp. RL TaxID=1452718 RepID=UPI000569CC4B|nr:HAD family hydrolase [Pseudomonas sp. RL]
MNSQALSSQAVIFDAFGTLLKIHEGSRPYRRLIKAGMAQGRRPQADDGRRIMTHPWGLRETAQAFGIELSGALQLELEDLLASEVASIEPFPDALEAVELLQSAGLAIAVCSNLAMPYAPALQRHFPTLDVSVLSFEVGAVKPDPEIYAACCDRLKTPPGNVLMVGDSRPCDCVGPEAIGIRGHHLDRLNGQGDYRDLVQFARQALRRRAK